MNKLPLFLLLALLSLTSTRLVIQSPPELKEMLSVKHPDGIPYSVANYGDVPFGKSMSGTIVIGSVLQNCVYDPLSSADQKKANKVVLSTRGDCTFTQKSINSQKQGAKLALIADSVDDENPGRIILVDDGRGPQVHIPTIFIEKQLGDLIENYITQKKSDVNLFVQFETHKQKKADITLWINSFDRKSYILIRQLQPYLDRIQQSITLKVRHPTHHCSTCLESDCYKGDHYCVNVGYWGYMIENFGRTVIDLQLKQELIFQKSGKENNFYQKWWDYMLRFDDECNDKYSLQDCSDDVARNVGLNVDQLDTAIKESFNEIELNNETVLDNKRLEQNRRERLLSGVYYYPAVVINNIQYRGNLQADQIFELACNSILERPQGCDLKEADPPSALKYVLIGVGIFGIFMIFLLVCFRRIVRREASSNINNEVNELVNEYITMYEAQKFQEKKEVNVE